jgi:hypothetical protein
MTRRNPDPRCRAVAKSGKRCRAAATAGGLCFFHANPAKASELGQIGGRSKRHSGVETVDALPTLDNALAIRDTVARLIADVYAGKIHPRIASGLTPLMNLQLRAIEITDLERRLAKLEKLLAKAEDTLNGSSSSVPTIEFGGLPMPKL